MIKSIIFPSLKNALITLLFVGILLFGSINSAWAKGSLFFITKLCAFDIISLSLKITAPTGTSFFLVPFLTHGMLL